MAPVVIGCCSDDDCRHLAGLVIIGVVLLLLLKWLKYGDDRHVRPGAHLLHFAAGSLALSTGLQLLHGYHMLCRHLAP